jgi:hypothetical protein
MDHPVMAPAQQEQVREVGLPPVGPVGDVMGVAPGVRSVTPREPAMTVPHDHGRRRGAGTTGVFRPTSRGSLLASTTIRETEASQAMNLATSAPISPT